MARDSKTGNRLWGIGILLLGLVGIFYTARIVVLALGQGDWIAVPAQVVQSHVSSRSKGSGFSTTVNAQFAFRYEVDGQSYLSDRYSYWSVGGDQLSGTQLYRRGERITVFHHPTWHHHAVAERRQPSFFVWVFMLGALVIAFGGGRLAWTGVAAG